MKHFFRILMFALLITSCGEKRTEGGRKPGWVLDEKKMAEIITDLRIADAATYINTNSPPRDKKKDWYYIMKKHGVEDSIFRKSHEYYAGYPEKAEKIYEEVIDMISEMQANYADGQ